MCCSHHDRGKRCDPGAGSQRRFTRTTSFPCSIGLENFSHGVRFIIIWFRRTSCVSYLPGGHEETTEIWHCRRHQFHRWVVTVLLYMYVYSIADFDEVSKRTRWVLTHDWEQMKSQASGGFLTLKQTSTMLQNVILILICIMEINCILSFDIYFFIQTLDSFDY